MARKAIVNKQRELNRRKNVAHANGTKMKHSTKHYNRCRLCGRVGSYYREFGICRVCLREYARQGNIMGLKKASR